jgi:hypothetical protein
MVHGAVIHGFWQGRGLLRFRLIALIGKGRSRRVPIQQGHMTLENILCRNRPGRSSRIKRMSRIGSHSWPRQNRHGNKERADAQARQQSHG